jgi:hypothetical protein
MNTHPHIQHVTGKYDERPHLYPSSNSQRIQNPLQSPITPKSLNLLPRLRIQPLQHVPCILERLGVFVHVVYDVFLRRWC